MNLLEDDRQLLLAHRGVGAGDGWLVGARAKGGCLAWVVCTPA